MNFTVFLGNLPTWVTADDIKAWLTAENLVADSVKVIRNHETQESKGFAFVEAPTADEMQAIIRRFDRAPLEDRLLRANPAQPSKGKDSKPAATGAAPAATAAAQRPQAAARQGCSSQDRFWRRVGQSVIKSGSRAQSGRQSARSHTCEAQSQPTIHLSCFIPSTSFWPTTCIAPAHEIRSGSPRFCGAACSWPAIRTRRTTSTRAIRWRAWNLPATIQPASAPACAAS